MPGRKRTLKSVRTRALENCRPAPEDDRGDLFFVAGPVVSSCRAVLDAGFEAWTRVRPELFRLDGCVPVPLHAKDGTDARSRPAREDRRFALLDRALGDDELLRRLAARLEWFLGRPLPRSPLLPG